MSLVQIPGQGLWLPPPPPISLAPAVNSAMAIDATGEKIAFIGSVFNADRSTKSITKVGFRFGTVTKAGGSGLTVSLQNVDTANGPPYQPDGTQDQTVAIANGDVGFVSNVWYQTGALSAARSVAFGELLSVVFEFDGGGRLGADVVNVTGYSLASSANSPNHGFGSSTFTASWASAAILPNVILEFDDGTFGTLGEWPSSATTTHTFNSGSTPDEHALEFTLPFPCRIDGAWVYAIQSTATATFDIVLYNGTTAVATVSVDANTLQSNSVRILSVTFPEVDYAVGDTFRLAVKPTTANNMNTYSFDVAAAGHFQAHAGGTSWAYTTRTDGGSWAAPTTTRRLFGGIRVSALDDGAGGGSGGGIRLAGGGGLAA